MKTGKYLASKIYKYTPLKKPKKYAKFSTQGPFATFAFGTTGVAIYNVDKEASLPGQLKNLGLKLKSSYDNIQVYLTTGDMLISTLNKNGVSGNDFPLLGSREAEVYTINFYNDPVPKASNPSVTR